MSLEKIQQEFSSLKQKGWQDASLRHYLERIDIILGSEWMSEQNRAIQIGDTLFNMKHNISIRNPRTGENTPVGEAFLKTQSAVDSFMHTTVPLQIAS